MREIDFNLKENPFINFQSSRYSMTARINVEKMWKYSKENNCSFFVLSLGCLMKAVNSIPQLKRRIVNNKVIEHDYLDGEKWHDYVKKTSKDVLSGKTEEFNVEMEKRDYENIANYSCIPWVDFESITSGILTGNQIQPLITWGKVNENYEMSVAITVSHIFVNGSELGLFYKKVQENFNQPI